MEILDFMIRGNTILKSDKDLYFIVVTKYSYILLHIIAYIFVKITYSRIELQFEKDRNIYMYVYIK